MTSIREPGKINPDTTLIDFGYADVAGAGGVYLIQSEKSCLIDGGSKPGGKRIIKHLKEINAFPPDYILLTHSHWDHCQGVPILLEYAKKDQKTIDVFASSNAIPLLADQSFNSIFHPKEKYQNITDVQALNEGDSLDLGGISLKIYDTPGHITDHISILDEKNKNLFVGDAIGMKAGDNAYLPPILPPFCNKDEFYSTIQKLRQLSYESISLAHFGYITGPEAHSILDEAESVFTQMWQIFTIAAENEKLDDKGYIYDMVVNEINPTIPEFKLVKPTTRMMLSIINTVRRIIRKSPISTADIMIRDVLDWEVLGFKLANNLL